MKIDPDLLFEKEPSLASKKMKNFKKIKQAEPDSHADAKIGRIIFISPEIFQVQLGKELFACSLKGTLKKELKQKKDRLACGDLVQFDPEKKVILHLEPRKTILMRQNPSHKFKEQVLATNIDLLLITASILEPSINPYLIDLYLITAQKAGLIPIILINKIDLLNTKTQPEKAEKEKQITEQLKEQYEALNIPFLSISASTLEGFKELRALMKDKASVFSGESGVGKSSLINSLRKSKIKVAPVSAKSKGVHTTTSSQLLELQSGGFCVDTPGIQSLSFKTLALNEVKHYFPEFDQIDCKFSDCNHRNEKGCGLKEALEKKIVSPLRLESYYRILAEIEQHKS
jgi:ribosome biogenesis GTPase